MKPCAFSPSLKNKRNPPHETETELSYILGNGIFEFQACISYIIFYICYIFLYLVFFIRIIRRNFYVVSNEISFLLFLAKYLHTPKST